jgi:outer membrane protein
MKLPLVAAAAALLASSAATAEFRAGIGAWRYDLTGTVTDRGQTYDFERDLEIQASGRRSVLIEWDTGPGLWPDLAVSLSALGAAGRHEETFTLFDLLGNPVGSQTESVSAAADFDDYDLTARYPFDWGALRFAVGLTAKRLRGTVLIDDSSNPPPSQQNYDETIPEVHAQVRVPLGKAFVLGASAQGIEAGGSSALEWRAALELRLLAPLLVEVGWQEKRYNIQLDSYALDARLGGALLRAGFFFR